LRGSHLYVQKDCLKFATHSRPLLPLGSHLWRHRMPINLQGGSGSQLQFASFTSRIMVFDPSARRLTYSATVIALASVTWLDCRRLTDIVRGLMEARVYPRFSRGRGVTSPILWPVISA